MPDDLISVGVLVLSWGATYLVHSTLLVTGVWGFLKMRPAAGQLIRETLWKTALVGGLATGTGQMLLLPVSPLGNLTWMLPRIGAQPEESVATNQVIESRGRRADSEAAARLAARTDTAGSDDEIAYVLEADVESDLSIGSRSSADTPSSGTIVTPYTPKANRAATRWGMDATTAPLLAVCVIVSGAIAFGILRSLWQTLAISRHVASCTPLNSGPTRELLDELLRLVPRAPRVRLLAAADDAEPAALGIWQWTIVLPRRAAEELSAEELRSLLAHELAHLVRGDAAWLGISRFVCSCLAFQPLNYFACREWQRAAEFLCDSWAIRHTGSPLALARCLTEVASWRLAQQPSAVLLAATGRKSGLVDRIERLLDARPNATATDDRGNRHRTVLLASIGLVFVAWCTPRVNVIVAGTIPERRATETNVSLDAGHESADEVAKPQVSGELEATAEAEASRVMDAQQASEERTAITALSVPQMLKVLDRELAVLEIELGEIEPLLRNAEGTPQATKLAERLQSEIARLKHRREMLKDQSKSVRQ